MESSHRTASAVVGGRGSTLLVFTTLAAALGFTPWVANSDLPWAQFAFRVLGLGALGAVAFASMRGVLSSSRWGVRATTAAVLVVLVSSLSAALSIHRGKSLEAMLNLLGILGLFLATALLLRGARLIRGIAMVEVLAAVPVAVVGIMQHFRPDLVPAESSYPGRALGPFGQPNRLGGYLIAAIPIAVALTFTFHDRLVRSALLLTILLLTLCLVYTFSRGAWIGFAAGMAVLAFALLRWPGLRPEPVLAALALLVLALPAFAAFPSITARLAHRPNNTSAWNLPFDPEREGSGAMRRAVWSGALAATAARPVLGWGIGAFREGFDRVKSATLKRLEAEGGRTADQAHSFYFETLTERGVLGLAAFLLFAGVTLAGGLTAIGTGAPAETRLLSAGLLASLTALLVHALLEDNLGLTAHAAVFAANAGLLVAAAPDPARLPRRRLWPAIALVAVLVGGVASFFSARAASAAAGGASWIRAASPGQAVTEYGRAADLAPWNDQYAIQAAKSAEAAAVLGDREARLEEAAAFYRRAIAANPSDPVTRHELARLYLANLDRFGALGLREASAQLRLALAQNPFYAEIRNDLGVALLRSGDQVGATRAFEEASQGRREFVDPLLNLAALAVRRGDRVEAERRIDEALVRHPTSERARAMKEEISGAVRR